MSAVKLANLPASSLTVQMHRRRLIASVLDDETDALVRAVVVHILDLRRVQIPELDFQ